MSDDDCLDLMYLYRVVRAGNHTPEELKRLKELMRRQAAEKRQERDLARKKTP